MDESLPQGIERADPQGMETYDAMDVRIKGTTQLPVAAAEGSSATVAGLLQRAEAMFVGHSDGPANSSFNPAAHEPTIGLVLNAVDAIAKLFHERRAEVRQVRRSARPS